jgi:hypothetical protein
LFRSAYFILFLILNFILDIFDSSEHIHHFHMASNTIDLDQTEKAVSSLITDEPRQGYQLKTLQSRTNGRYAYLPLFPTKSFGPNNCLLFANVPGSSFKIYLLINLNLFVLIAIV